MNEHASLSESRLKSAVFALGICWILLLLVFGIGTLRISVFASRAEKQVYSLSRMTSASAMLLKGSAVLTEQVRLFVLTGREEYMNAYFYEAESEQTRDKALAIVHRQNDPRLDELFLQGLNASRELMQTEYHAMKLACLAYGIASQPREVAGYPLTVEEQALSPAEKRERALNMLIDSSYAASKAEINRAAEEFARQVSTKSENSAWYQIRLLNHNIMLMRIGLAASLAVFLGFMFVFLVAWRYRENQTKMLREYRNKFREQEKINLSDHLTGLPNRLWLHEFIGSRLADLSENPDLYVACVDIDFFKSINDTYGHVEGDNVLCRVAEVFEKINDECGSFCARWGGDEFVFIFQAKDNAEAETFRFKVKEAVSISNEGQKTKISISMGFARCDSAIFEETLKKADKELYEDKKTKHL
ncbi:MAG: GGDEF domain-containing protein [Abditibacteriota bacterium]|nr:GGDEF domain-containing protein [Abditibacteriota bacterium]